MREALHRVLVDLVAGLEPSTESVEVIAGEHRRAQAHVGLVPLGEHLAKGSPALRFELFRPIDVETILWQVARCATDLLTEVDATRLRVCPGDEAGCGWVVLDSTRNRSRRWCDMGACGNSVKAARLTARRRAARSGIEAPA